MRSYPEYIELCKEQLDRIADLEQQLQALQAEREKTCKWKQVDGDTHFIECVGYEAFVVKNESNPDLNKYCSACGRPVEFV